MQGRERVIEGFRLAPQQKRLWRLRHDSHAYYAQCAILIEGDIELVALEEALKKILRKHEILRTTLDWFPGLETPIQLILENPPLPYRRVDLNGKGSGDLETAMGDLFREESRPFDLKRGQLVRFCLSRLSASRQVLLISLHALCADGWTLRNLFKEITGFYAAELEGKELIDEPVQYLQFSEWQNELLEEKSDEAQIKGREPGFSASELMLPLESSRAEDSESNHSPFFPESAAFMLDPRMTSRIEAFSGAHGSSVSGFLLACWQILLWRLSAEEEIFVECLFDGRRFDELHAALGLFATYLPVRGTFVSDLRFDETVDRAMISLRQAHLSQEFFLRDSATREAADRINAVSFEYEEWPEAKQVGPVRFSYWKQYSCHDRFKLKLGGYHKADGLTIEIQYDPALFSREVVELFQERYLRLIESAIEREEALVGELEIIGQRELERQLVAWNRTEEKEPDSDYIHELIARQARFRPESIAVIYKEEQLSYGELEGRANQLANYLGSLRVGPDHVVGLYLERSTEMIVGLLGILKAGAAYLPLETGQPVERLRVMLDDAGARVIVTSPDLTGNLPADGREVVMLDDGCRQIAAYSREAPKVAVSQQNLAYVLYTSGSTGKPKGVMVRHGAVVNLWEWLKGSIYEGEGAAPTVSLNAPLAFDASVKQVVQLGSGARLCVVPGEERLDAEFMLAYLRRNEVEVLDCTPSQLRMLVEAGLGKGESYSKVVLVGGEEIDRQSWGALSESGEIKYYNVYGPTECTVDATACRVCVGMEPTIGRPIRNTQIYILDERGEVAPTGVVGEIYIGGAGLARGYLGAAGMTAEKFTPNPFGSRDGERLYRTGDLGRYLVDGRIAFEGRRDEQVKVRGHRIELGEIEEVLRSYPGVGEAVVALREDELQQRQLVGYVVENAKTRMTVLREEELRRYVRDRLPSYMDLATIVVMKELPLTNNGKVDRRLLPKPEAVRSEAQIEERRPGNAYEEIISGIWKQVLKVEPVRPGDNFFEIGGHSLLATQVISRVRNAFGVEIGVITIFQDATVEALALRVEEAIKKGEKDAAPPLVRVSREGSLPLSFAQQRLWFIDQLEPGNAIYNCPSAVRVEGHLNLEALERAVNEIVRRHEALRTRIEVKEGNPAQVIEEWKPRRIEVEDLTSLTREEREEEAGRIAQEEAGTGFDLSRGPLLRVKALKLEEEQHIVLFTMHHIVGDGWSMGILSREVGELYRAYRAGGKSPFDELPIQYADFAVWQRGWLKGPVLKAELEYWRNQLAGMEVLDLPTDYPRPAAPSYRGARRRFVIDRELTQGLRDSSQREGVTLFMTLMGGFEILMSRYSGQADVALGTDIANRNRAEIEGLIGFFVNQLVLRVEVRAAESVREFLKRVRAVCLGAYAHQDVPFEKLVEELQPERDLSRAPLFQVKLILQNAPGEDLELEGVRLRSGGAGELQLAKLDMTVMFVDEGAELVGVVEYSRDLFEEETIARLMSHYANVLMAIADDREKPIAELSLLSAAEREQIVTVWNETGRSYPQCRCAHELFTEQAARVPDRIALISEEQMVSYGALNRRANQLGRYLQRLGVGPEVVVGVCLERSVEMVIAVMGALKAGGAYLPLDSEYPLGRLSFMVEEAGVGAVMTQRKLEERLPAFWGQMVMMDEEWERISEESEDEPESGVVAENLAYVIYTSGSTGSPKGVMVRHRGLCNLMEAQKEGFRLGEWSRVLQFASLSFDASVSEIFSTLGAGGGLRLSGRERLMGGDELARVVRDDQITTVTLPPTVLGALREEEWIGVETVISAGEACSGEIVERWARGRRMLNAYGPTEATVCASIGECEELGNGKPAIGRPIANTRLYILDREMETEPVGVRGELYIGGEGVGRGYLGRPELTAERFIPNRFSREGGERLYRTGDVVRYLSDGEIEFIGRADEQVKLRGYRIEPGEIENVLSKAPGVQRAAVVLREDEPGQERLVAYVVTDLAARDRPFARPGAQTEIELWPSVAEYFVYDDALYYAMTHDERRNRSYRVAIDERVRDKVVLDIGTGPDAILARMCVEAGAKKVYAIELLEETYQKAKSLLSRLGLENRIELIHGDSTKVQLPEDVDICVSEIVGSIGGCEGAGRLLNDAWRFMKTSGVMIPCRSRTLIAAARLPETLRTKPRFSGASGYYAEKIFEQLGYRFDLRLCVKNFPMDHVISEEAVFEDLDFNLGAPDEESHEISLTISERTILDGFLIWLTLYTTPEEVIDILKSPHSWLPVFFPVFYPGLEVWPGDRIKAVCSRGLCGENQINPDYRIEGKLIRRNGDEVSFCYHSPHFQKSYKSNPFYKELLGSESSVEVEGRQTAESLLVELRRAVEDHLPKYMAPSAIVLMDRLPLTRSGKLDRRALPAPELDRARIEKGSMSARTPVEEIIIGIFEEVLKLDRVGRRDNFFEIGGHSLLATQVVSRVRNAFGVEIGVGAIFEAATAESLAHKIEEAIRAGEKTEAPPLIRAPRDKMLPLSFAQRRLWFTDQLTPGSALYNCSGAVRLEGVLQLEVLEGAVNEIVRRHEVLRTRIEVAAGEPAQVIDEWEYRKLQVEDLSGLEREEREEEVERIAKEESGTGFDLSRGPLMRIRVLKLEEEQHAVLFTMHHIVSDAWSMGVLVREISELYQAMGDGRESPLPDLAIQYADYAYWQNQYLTGAILEKHLAYWKKQLGGNLPTLDLPADHPRPSVPSHRGAAKSFVFSPELTQSLKALSRREGVTTFMLLLAAFKTLLHKYSAQEDIILGTSALNRNRAEIEPLIGFFVNMLPMRTNLRGNPKFSELLRRVKDVTLGVYAHQDLPFERLVEEVRPKRSARQAPLFNVVFGVQNAPKEDLRLQGVQVRPINAEQEKARFDVTVWVTESGESMQVSWVYSKDLFEEATVARMHGHFETLLFNIVDRPDARLTTLKISATSAVRASHREEDDREDSELRKPISTKGRGANLPTEPA